MISKNFGHSTLGSGGKNTFNWYLKKLTDRLTDRQKDRHTDIWTNRLIESNGPEGGCFENAIDRENQFQEIRWVKPNLQGHIS